MNISSHRNNNRKTSALVIGGAVFLLTCLYVAINSGTQGALASIIRSAVHPIVAQGSTVVQGIQDMSYEYMGSKKQLLAENELLLKRVRELERAAPADRLAALAVSSRDALTETLASFELGIHSGKKAVLADVVSYVDFPFGTLFIEFYTPPQDTAEGQKRYVYTEDGTVIGLLDSYSGKTGIVSLFSRAGSEQHMRIGGSELALVTGMGGVTMRAVVPKSTEVYIGDPVSLPEAGNALVGSVGEITSAETDTTQLVLIRLSASPLDVRTVFILE